MLKAADALTLIAEVGKLEDELRARHGAEIKSAKKRAKRRRQASTAAELKHNMEVHRVCGHERMANLKQLSDRGYLHGLTLKGNGDIGWCETCAHTRGRRAKFKKKSATRSRVRGERVHSDLKQMDAASFEGFRWIITFVCDCSRYARTYYLKSKSDAHLAFAKYISEELDPLDLTLRELRIDGGTEYGRRGESYAETSAFKQLLRSKPQGATITVERAPPFCQQMNGVAERYNQTLLNTIRSILRDQARDRRMWPHAARLATRIRNCMPTVALEGSTPHQRWFGAMPDKSRWRHPLCDVFTIHYADQAKTGGGKRTTTDDRRDKMIYVGESRDSPCYLCFNPNTNTTVERRYEDCLFQSDVAARGGGMRGSDSGTTAAATDPTTTTAKSKARTTATEKSKEKATEKSTATATEKSNRPKRKRPDDRRRRVRAKEHDEAPDGIAGTIDLDAVLERGPKRSTNATIATRVKMVAGKTVRDALTTLVPGNDKSKKARPYRRADLLYDLRLGRIVMRRRGYDDEAPSATLTRKPKTKTNARSTRRRQTRQTQERPVTAAGPKNEGGRRLTRPDRLRASAFRVVDKWNNNAGYTAFEDGGRAYAYHVNAGVIPTPKGMKNALKGKHAKKWRAAIKAEWSGLWKRGTFEWVRYDDLPANAKVMTLLWQFKVKPDRLKARCCLNGTQEREDEYGDIFAPVCRHTSMRALLWKALGKNWSLGQCDVTQAYLWADNLQQQWVHAPPMFARPGYCLRLRKCLYGKHSSGADWHSVMTEWLTTQAADGNAALVQSKVDECIYALAATDDDGNVKLDADGNPARVAAIDRNGAPILDARGNPTYRELYVCLYVDDLLYTGDEATMAQFKTAIDARFDVRHLDATEFLGLSIDYDRRRGVLTLGQEEYIRKILRRFGMSNCTTRDTPMAKSGWTLPRMQGPCQDHALQTEYRQKVGSLMFLSTSTRADISFCVKELSRHLVHPTEVHMRAADRCLRYLAGTIDHGLIYRRTDSAIAPSFYGSADADWAGEDDTAKSTSGFAFSGGSGALSWRAGTQAIVAHSSTEAELIALDESCRELQYLIALLADLRIDVQLPVEIAQDNQSTIKLVNAGRFNARTRHINVRYHYCHDLQEAGTVRVRHLGTEFMPADVLTKALGKVEHRRHSDVLLGRSQLEGA